MSSLILGVVLLFGLLMAGKWFVNAEPKRIISVIKWLVIGIAGLLALFLIVTGRIALAFWLLPLFLPWLMRARMAAQNARNFSRMSSGGSGGMSSEVSSEFLEMRLDHDSGDLEGRVRKGLHNGKNLKELSPTELVDLYDTYTVQDIESARLLAAYLDRVHPEWRDASAKSSSEHDPSGHHSGGAMGRDEALRVLGLDETADKAAIKAAHHRLIANLHPDRGGSAYLASKINEARDVLLKS